MQSDLLAAALLSKSELIENRRYLHRNPEISFQEYRTAEFIESKLAAMNIRFSRIAETGVIARIGTGERCVALRADIDALPIEEKTELPYASQNSGVMHACGHDCHTAMLLTAAKILKERENELGGTVKLLFQPGEEKVPGGASLMIAAGALTNPMPEAIFGQHVFPDSDVGTILTTEGMMMASADELYWTLTGKGAHAAQPHQGTDPIIAAAELILHLQSIITKSRNPLVPGLLGITAVNGGSATNIIPEVVEMKGTLRSFDMEWRKQTLNEIAVRTEKLCDLFGVKGVCNIVRGYPPVWNDPICSNFVIDIAKQLAGADCALDFEPKMWGEDFGYYGRHIPAAFWMLGVRSAGENNVPGLHNPRFSPDESALPLGAAMLASAAVEWLSK
ncbi:M20 family metallopeptidase [Ignavibacteria bacterium]|nr:amidohydrolase [Bacteroidota bacterium]MCZ2132782.1 M20 family metallopeptidase [Bacteroidota bacterium]